MMAEDLMVRVPQVWTNIFFHLDGRSLHIAQQVCPDWNIFIKAHILGTVEGRRE